jgi:hypothetical protein
MKPETAALLRALANAIDDDPEAERELAAFGHFTDQLADIIEDLDTAAPRS